MNIEEARKVLWKKFSSIIAVITTIITFVTAYAERETIIQGLGFVTPTPPIVYITLQPTQAISTPTVGIVTVLERNVNSGWDSIMIDLAFKKKLHR